MSLLKYPADFEDGLIEYEAIMDAREAANRDRDCREAMANKITRLRHAASCDCVHVEIWKESRGERI